MRWRSTSCCGRCNRRSQRWQTTPPIRNRAAVTTTSSNSPTFRSLTPSVCYHDALYDPVEAYSTPHRHSFGRVLLVRLRQREQQTHFAMKVLRKTDVVRLRQVEHVNAERFILARIRHPFIVDLYATFQDHLNIYMLLSYVPGGEMFSHLRRAQHFSADVTRFCLAIIVLALRYLHSSNIIYRDLTPENLLLDTRGYLKIADFGFAKVVGDRTWTLCGTPEYLAPKIIQSDGHGKAVDWWACGILCYEMLVGYTVRTAFVLFQRHIDVVLCSPSSTTTPLASTKRSSVAGLPGPQMSIRSPVTSFAHSSTPTVPRGWEI